MKEENIKCPHCQNEININQALYAQLESEYKAKFALEKKDFEAELNKKRAEYKESFAKLKVKEAELAQEEERREEEFKAKVKQELKLMRTSLEENLKKELREEQEEALQILNKQVEEKSLQIRELNKVKIENENLKREKDELESFLRAENEQKLNEKLRIEREKIQKKTDEETYLKFQEKDKQLKDLQEQLLFAQRKAEAVSNQLQGEVQELAIETWLKSSFPFDHVEEIKKGVRGGDCIQIVHTREFQNCGKIYYESKRTQEFNKNWIDKFKADIIEKGADCGVLVTETMPNSMKRMGLYEGIWLCTFEEFKALSAILRENIIQLYVLSKSEENKTEKSSLIYNYFRSKEFAMNMENIVRTFTSMQKSLDNEKRVMTKLWKQREKEIELLSKSSGNIYGSLQGIAGNEIEDIKVFQLEYIDESLENKES